VDARPRLLPRGSRARIRLIYLASEQYGALVEAELKKRGNVIKATGIKIDQRTSP
jgi:hypothetical protein